MHTIREAGERNTHHGKLLEKRLFSRGHVVGLENCRCFGGGGFCKNLNQRSTGIQNPRTKELFTAQQW